MVDRLKNPVVAGLLVTIAVSVLLASYRLGWRLPILTDAIESLELKTLDWRFRIRGPLKPGGQIVILAFDDLAMAQRPDLFEKRDGWVEVLRALQNYEVKSIGIDALFVDPERILSSGLQSKLDSFFAQSPVLPKACTEPMGLLEKVYGETQGDQRLEKAIEDLGNVVLACHAGKNGSRDPDMDLSKASYGQASPGVIDPPLANGAIPSMPVLNSAALALGVITVAQDSSQSVRKLVAVRRYGRSYLAPMAIELLAAFQDIPRSSVIYLGDAGQGHAEVRVGKSKIELDMQNSFSLNYRGGPGTFPTFSVKDLVDRKIPKQALKKKIALIGFTYFGHDRVKNPFSGDMPGVEVHATATDNIIQGDPIEQTPWWLDTLVSVLFGVFLSFLYWRKFDIHPITKAGGSALLLAGYLALAMAMFAYEQAWISCSGPLAIFFLLNLVCLTLSYVSEGLQRRRIRAAFSHYLSNEVIEQLMARPDSLKLGGERCTLTVLFSDIRGFTTLSEGMDPQRLSSLLNQYLTPMTRIVLEHRGLLDKYIGDAIMAVFGAPVPYEQHPLEACRTALDMLDELEGLNRRWKEEGIQPLRIGIGINTGIMSVGNMGSEDRFDYTVIGDDVNLASRLEGLNKLFGTAILISQSTRDSIGDAFTCREVDMVAVKGKKHPVRIFELVHSGAPGEKDSWIREFESALTDYRQGHFDTALKKFHEIHPRIEDKPSQVFIERCENLIHSRHEGWDGVYRAEKK